MYALQNVCLMILLSYTTNIIASQNSIQTMSQINSHNNISIPTANASNTQNPLLINIQDIRNNNLNNIYKKYIQKTRPRIDEDTFIILLQFSKVFLNLIDLLVSREIANVQDKDIYNERRDAFIKLANGDMTLNEFEDVFVHKVNLPYILKRIKKFEKYEDMQGNVFSLRRYLMLKSIEAVISTVRIFTV